MIGFLRGKVIAAGGAVFVDAGGIGFEVQVSPGFGAYLESLGPEREAMVWTYAHFAQDGVSLFGFGSRKDLEAFKLLLSVSGIGPRIALNMVSELPPPRIFRCILGRDLTSLMRVKGVGKKTAERIVVELSDRMKGMLEHEPEPLAERAASGEAPGPPAGPPEAASNEAYGAVEQALKALGYSKSETEAAMERAWSELGGGPPAVGAEELLREALRALGEGTSRRGR